LNKERRNIEAYLNVESEKLCYESIKGGGIWNNKAIHLCINKKKKKKKGLNIQGGGRKIARLEKEEKYRTGEKELLA